MWTFYQSNYSCVSCTIWTMKVLKDSLSTLMPRILSWSLCFSTTWRLSSFVSATTRTSTRSSCRLRSIWRTSKKTLSCSWCIRVNYRILHSLSSWRTHVWHMSLNSPKQLNESSETPTRSAQFWWMWKMLTWIGTNGQSFIKCWTLMPKSNSTLTSVHWLILTRASWIVFSLRILEQLPSTLKICVAWTIVSSANIVFLIVISTMFAFLSHSNRRVHHQDK